MNYSIIVVIVVVFSFYFYVFVCLFSSINGVKDMLGYRQALKLSYLSVSEGDNSSESCNFEDDVETSAILVCRCV